MKNECTNKFICDVALHKKYKHVENCLHAKPHAGLEFCGVHMDCDEVPKGYWQTCRTVNSREDLGKI
jgi:hypothetical protein